MPFHQLHFDTNAGQIPVPVKDGDVVLVAGPNGVGKSALLASFYRNLPEGTASYLPGHRQINFNNGSDALAQSLLEIKKNLFQHIEHFSRYKNAWAEDHFRSIIRLLNNSESAYNRQFRKAVEDGELKPQERASLKLSPVDTLNVIFKSARLPVSFDATDEGMSAIRGERRYRIDALSDGERAALFIAGAIITQPANTVLLIDEPEKHLHPSISAPFVQAAIRARNDICIVMASHDVSVIDKIEFSNLIYIQDSNVLAELPEMRVYKAHVIDNRALIPEALRIDVLGARSDILFVEGGQQSQDIALYSHIYPSVKVVPKGGYEKVIEAVKALRGSSAQHWVSPYGLIDGDGRSHEEKEKLLSDRIGCLPFPSIENLFFLDEAIDCFVAADLVFNGSDALKARIENLGSKIIGEVRHARADIVAKRSSWIVERELSSKKLSTRDIKLGSYADIEISVGDIVSRVESAVDIVLDKGGWREILLYLPIKETRLPNVAAKLLGATSYSAYHNVIIRQLNIDAPTGITLIERLRRLLPTLGETLRTPFSTHSEGGERGNVIAFNPHSRPK